MRISFAFPLRRDFRVLRYPRTTLPLLITRASWGLVSRVPKFLQQFRSGTLEPMDWASFLFFLGAIAKVLVSDLEESADW